jgi:hypothetical protein
MPRKRYRLDRESKTVVLMVSLYCHDCHQNADLCSECAELIDYALERLQKCPFQEGKTTCAKCPVHCYQLLMRERMRTVMRYSGPRMTYRHPVLALLHLIDGMRKQPVSSSQNPKQA